METAIEKSKDLKKNIIYGFLQKLVTLLSPILITPYVARILGPNGTGIYSYSFSIVSYFIIVANVGIETYGQRVIAMHRGEKDFLKKFVVDITTMRMILTAICSVVYYIMLITLFSNKPLYMILSGLLIFTAIDFTWFFQGVEDFKLISLVSIFSKILYFILIFLFVKTENDLNTYTFITVVTTIAPYILSLPYLVKYLRGAGKVKINPFLHFKECMVYFIPTIAISIYTILDKTLIGLLVKGEYTEIVDGIEVIIKVSDLENGYYEQAEKIAKLPITIFTTYNSIIRPRISYKYAINDITSIKNIINKSLHFMFGLIFAAMFGIILIAKVFVPLYLGDGFESCINLLYIFSILIPVISISNLIGTHYYTPFGYQRISNIFLIIGAVVNLILNLILIPMYKSMGATIASVCAEIVILVLYVVFSKKYFNTKMLLSVMWKYLLSAIIMFIGGVLFNYLIQGYEFNNIVLLLLNVLIGAATYLIMICLLRTEFVKEGLKIFQGYIRKISGR